MKLILFYFAVIYSTWIFYTSVMCLRRARDEGRFTPVIRQVAYLTVYVGLVLDVFLNTIMSLPFLELPRWFDGEILLISRLKRLIKGADGGPGRRSSGAVISLSLLTRDTAVEV